MTWSGLFLDDERFEKESDGDCTLVRNVSEFKAYLMSKPMPKLIGFDYWLGVGRETGMDALEFLIGQLENRGIDPATLTVVFHSSDRQKRNEMYAVWSEFEEEFSRSEL